MIEALYLINIGLPDEYDGPVLDSTAIMAAAMDIINGGEDDVPMKSIACERVDSPPVADKHTDGALLERARNLFDDIGRHPDSAYTEGWHDALRAVLGEEDV